MQNLFKASLIAAWVFVVARIYLSYMWLINAENKVLYDFQIGTLLESQANSGVLPAWWASFLKTFIIPNTAIFEILVTIGELCVGIALLLGIFTRFAAMMGVIMNFSFFMTFQANLDLQMLIMQVIIVIFATTAGRIGLDRYVRTFTDKHLKFDKRGENYV
ncbi:DoxX family protein [Bacillus sp. HMF5848]|uniref:DoxX family protein n=1 Tax=Bacillus sp. HMF5848 TaxID=2495421 RepID=UPI000F77842D|nr:DoxX family protein [Bacillus sp. HMF5848]RSK29128.1 DoxX family protein [Bacillus sp. HMF5848]